LKIRKVNHFAFLPTKRGIAALEKEHNSIHNGATRVRFEVLTAVTMKNAVVWDIKTQFVPHRGHITSPLQSPAG
jgi:hypothetical protein